jgi:glycosyltransferase involved in cell wall biosynthesis
MKLSVIIPFYNEERTIENVLREAANSPVVQEIIAVDDGSQDGSYAIVRKIADELPEKIRIYRHEKNSGKGEAIKTARKYITGELVIIQDADLEYSPAQYESLIKPFENPEVMAVYGSRNLVKNPRSANSFYLGGVFLSKLTNLLYKSNITDESTCYKVFRSDLFKSVELECTGFEFCPEITAKILKKGVKIIEVPISYSPRSRSEGKKIKWSDGAVAIWTLIKYRFKN